MSDTRIYRIDDGDTAHLVRAPNAAQAVRHVAKKFKARVATQDDLVTLTGAGTKVQTATNGHDDIAEEQAA